MELDLFDLIETPEVSARFDLYSDAGSLYRWIRDHPLTRALQALAEGDQFIASAVAERAISLFDAPAPKGYRTDHEAAICFYAVVLSRVEHPDARRALDDMDANSTRVYGWLDLILGRALRDASTTTWLVRHALGPDVSVLGAGASTSLAQPAYWVPTSFDQVVEGASGEIVGIGQ